VERIGSNPIRRQSREDRNKRPKIIGDVLPMSIWTVLMLIAFNGYLLYPIVRARKAIWRCGPAMAAGIAVGFATVVFGEFASRLTQ
jgi:hypothetical protein